MFKKNQYDRQFKFSLRKKRGGGGAASFIIGSIVFGSLFLGNVAVQAETSTESTNETTTLSQPASESTTSSKNAATISDSTEADVESDNTSAEPTTDKNTTTDETADTTTAQPVVNNITPTPTVGTVPSARVVNGSVNVKYVDNTGAEVGLVTVDGPVGESYVENVKENIPAGYELASHTVDYGTYSTESKSITVTVDPLPANKKGMATVNYVDENGQIVKTLVATGFIGDQIDAGSWLPAGYTIAEKDQKSANGSLYETNPTTITVYVKPGSNQELKDELARKELPDDGTQLALSDGTAEGLRAKVAGLSKEQLANNKINVTNITLNKKVVKESEGMDLTATFDWNAIGIRKGDVMVIPMSPAFDSTNRLVQFDFSSAKTPNMGTMVLDYDKEEIYVEFRKDLDPNKVYHGNISIGTWINRQFFNDVDNDYTFNIPTPNGDVVQKSITVQYDRAPEYDKGYARAISQTFNSDETESDVTWAIEVNPLTASGEKDTVGQYNMKSTEIYITPDTIDSVSPTYDYKGDLLETNVTYLSNSKDIKVNEDSIHVYEANINPSMGYTKGKELQFGTDYEIIEGAMDARTDVVNPNVHVIHFINDYAVTNKKFVVEFTTHHTNLTQEDKEISGDKAAKDTEIGIHSLVNFFEANNKGETLYRYNELARRITESFIGDILGANIQLINSGVTTESAEALRGSVIVSHVDATTGKTLKPDGFAIDGEGHEMRNVDVGTSYTTNPEYFDGYQFTSLAYDSENPDGTVEQGVKHVVYQYTPVSPKGSVDVIYLSESGEILQPWTAIQTNQPEGTAYTTELKAFPGYKFVRMSELSADPTGSVQADKTLHVIYVYTKVGSVDVKYIDDATGEILPFDEAKLTAATVADGDEQGQPTTDVAVGTNYTTEEKSFAGYHFVGMDKTSSPVSGKVLVDPQLVIYRYAKDVVPAPKTGNVDVTYVDTEGNVLPGGDTTVIKQDAPVGDTYETNKREFTGYTFKRMGDKSAAANGSVVEGTQHVVYVYEKIPEAPKTGNVDVKYIDKATGEVIPGGELTEVKKGAPVGQGYFTEQKDFSAQGYHYVGLATDSAAAAGIVVEGDQHVIYEYEKIKQGSVDVRYIDRETGKDIVPGGEVAPVVTGYAGTAYGTQQKDFSEQGYKFIGMSEVSANPDGVVEADKTLHVIYEYVKVKGSVDVIYVDEKGQTLPGGDKTAVKTDAPDGEAYTTTQRAFTGYSFDHMGVNSASASGNVVGGQTLHVVYVYTKDPEVKKSNVDVTYVTEDGKYLKATKAVFDAEQIVGTEYTTEQKNFLGYHFVRMADFSAPDKW